MKPLPHFVVPAVAVFLLGFAWLLVHAYAHQLQTHTLCSTWPECYRTPAVAVVPDPSEADGIEWMQAAADGVLLAALAGLAGFGWKRHETTFDRRWGIPVIALALVATGAAVRFAYVGPGVLLWQWLAALVVCALLWWLVLRERRFLCPLAETGATRALRSRVLLALGLALFAALLGSWAAAHAIGLPCPDFPACRGEWWPGVNLITVATADTAPPDEPAALALAISHRLAVFPVLIYIMWLGLHLWRTGAQDHLCRYGLLVLGTLLLVVAVGIMGAVTRLPPVTAVAHSAASALLILSLVTLYHVVQPATRPGKDSA